MIISMHFVETDWIGVKANVTWFDARATGMPRTAWVLSITGDAVDSFTHIWGHDENWFW